MSVPDAFARIAGLASGEDDGGWHAALGGVLVCAARLLGLERSAAELPFRCAQAAGCPPHHATPVAAAWVAGYIAAHLLDAVEDGDYDPAGWDGLPPAQAINLAGALLAAGPMLLDDLEDERLRADLAADFRRVAWQMSAGQHADLTGWIADGAGAVERYWQVAAAKSGSLFSLACRAGARLAGPPPDILRAYSDFGHTLGLSIQVCDDFRDAYDPDNLADLQAGRVSLPIVYGRTVAGPAERERLEQLLAQVAGDAGAADALRRLLDDLGARHYLLLQVELLHQQAADALRRTMAAPPDRDWLQSWMPTIANFQSLPPHP